MEEDLKDPLVPRPLIEWLESTHPDRVPDASVPHSEKCALAGEQRVVRQLRALFKQQQEGDKD